MDTIFQIWLGPIFDTNRGPGQEQCDDINHRYEAYILTALKF